MTALSSAPEMPQEPKTFEEFSQTREDEYFWFRNKEDARVKPHLEAENAYYLEHLKPHEGFTEKVYEELVAREDTKLTSCPVKMGAFEYFTRYPEGKEHPCYVRRAVSGGNEEVLFDVNEMVGEFPNIQVMGWEPSPSHKLLALILDSSGQEEGQLFVKNLESGELKDTGIGKLSSSLEWGKGDDFIFVVGLSDQWRPDKIFRVDAQKYQKTLLLEEADPKFFVGVGKSSDSAYLIASAHSKVTTECRFISLEDNEAGEFELFREREQGLEYDIDHHPTLGFCGETNYKELNRKWVQFEPGQNPEDWKVLYSGSDSEAFRFAGLEKDYAVLFSFVEGLSKAQVYKIADGSLKEIMLAEGPATVGMGPHAEIGDNALPINVQSLKDPLVHFSVDLETLEKVEIHRKKVPNYNSDEYETQTHWVTSHDGFKFPVSLLYKKGTDLSAENNCVLYGYGSYGAPMNPTFSTRVLPMVDRGFVFAMAHIRGGGELGERVYQEQGKFLTKKNTFLDFEAAAQSLIDEKITAKKKISIMGGSAGGLLVGATLNQNPGLYAGALGFVAFVDVVNTMLDETLPLTPIEWEEWGDPRQEEFYNYIRSYSPYDNIQAVDHPPTLFTGGWNDPRVTYWEPAKMVARLRRMNTSSAPILLNTEMDAGHAGSSGRFAYLKDVARDYGFLILCHGVQD